MSENKGKIIEESQLLGKYDMAKNFLIGGLSGMTATSCVSLMP